MIGDGGKCPLLSLSLHESQKNLESKKSEGTSCGARGRLLLRPFSSSMTTAVFRQNSHLHLLSDNAFLSNPL